MTRIPSHFERSRPPKKLSIGEETLALHFKAYGIEVEREVKFSDRGYRWDFCFSEYKLAIEIDGGTVDGKSAHSKGDGYIRDCRKANLACILGWGILRFTTAMVISGEAIDTILEALANLK